MILANAGCVMVLGLAVAGLLLGLSFKWADQIIDEFGTACCFIFIVLVLLQAISASKR
jgi:uncharacterized membrane protein YdjX (TVP38/TMEM64 family)